MAAVRACSGWWANAAALPPVIEIGRHVVMGTKPRAVASVSGDVYQGMISNPRIVSPSADARAQRRAGSRMPTSWSGGRYDDARRARADAVWVIGIGHQLNAIA